MATLKDDDGSWQADSVKRKMFRQSKEQPEQSKKRSKKNTRKWCKGVVGREHDFEWQIYRGWQDWKVQVCNNCGKHGKHDFKFPWSTQNETT